MVSIDLVPDGQVDIVMPSISVEAWHIEVVKSMACGRLDRTSHSMHDFPDREVSMVRIVVGITGATGAVIGVRILQALRSMQVETHLVMSRWGKVTLEMETEYSQRDVWRMADHVYGANDQAAAISSGSFQVDGMIIAPCSMKTLAAIRMGFGEGLLARAADVTLKERRKLVIVPREAPLSEIHLENMLALTRMGAIMFPPVPAFYNLPKSIDDLLAHVVARVLDQFGVGLPEARRWNGLRPD